MKAGFAKINITPPAGTNMLGWGKRDVTRGCDGAHDDIFARALYLEHRGESALVIAYDLLFLGRADSDRFKGAIGNRLDLAPRRILLNCSHTHDGPAVGTWGFAAYTHPPDEIYIDELAEATVEAALKARENAREAEITVGRTRNRIPVSRRLIDESGKVLWAPNPEGEVCDDLPVCLVRGVDGAPVCLLFSICCHPSTTMSHSISADYPGAATARLAEELGADVAMFLQGCGGDAKACVIARDGRWSSGTWEDIDEAGRIAADEVAGCLKSGLEPVEPSISSDLVEMRWPLRDAPSRDELEAFAAGDNELRKLWARRQLEYLDRGRALPTHAPILAQKIEIGEGLRFIALEGEPVGGFGRMIRDSFAVGVTFPLGYSNGQGLYLPTERMLAEGGYEAESAYEYGWPANLAPGYEAILRDVLTRWA